MTPRVVRVELLLPLAGTLVALAAFASADAPVSGQSHATIRGTGTDVSIVYRGAASKTAPSRAGRVKAAPPRDARATDANAVVAEAERLAAKGAGDDAIITYLRAHQTGLPTIVEADAARGLRKAGAGPSVITELSRLTAVDVGMTAPDAAPVAAAYAGPPPPDDAGYFPGANGGYPYYGGYGGGAFFPRAHGRVFAHSHVRPMGMPGHGGGPGRPPALFSAPGSSSHSLRLMRP
jgi:hypothetical protein